MSNAVSRESYIESEYKKWEEKFEIPFEVEFNVKALLSLQHQFMNLPDDHVKAKAEIMRTISDIQRTLNLKRKANLENKIEVVLLAKETGAKIDLVNFLHKLLNNQILTGKQSMSKYEIETDTSRIRIVDAVNSENWRGMRGDFVYGIDLARDSAIAKR